MEDNNYQFNGEISFSLVSKKEDEATSEMPIKKGMLNPYGVVNAGAIIWFADVNASLLVTDNLNPKEGEKGFPLAININANLMRNRREGKFIAVSRYIKKGRTVTVVNTVVKDEDGNVMADVTSNHVLA